MGTKIRHAIFYIAYTLVLLGAALYLTRWEIAPYLFAVGAAGITVSYLSVRTEQMNFRQKRLHRFNVLAGILMVVASGFMFRQGTEWILFLTLAAVFQTYAAFASSSK